MADKRIIEGRNPVREALLGNGRIEEIVVAANPGSSGLRDIIGLAQEKRIKVRRTTQNEITEISRSRSHQGIIAICPPYRYADLDDLLESVGRSPKPALLVVLDGIEDPGNLGSIIRTSECGGADGVIIRERRAAGVTPSVEKAAAGATQHVPVCQVNNIRNALERIKEAGIWAIGATGDGSQAYHEADFTVPLAIVIGSEGKGLSRLVREACDYTVSVPMFGKIGSLNAAVAAAIVIYEAVRQRLCR